MVATRKLNMRFSSGYATTGSALNVVKGSRVRLPGVKREGRKSRIGAGLNPRHGCFLFLARIISRVDIVDASWPYELHLDHRPFVACPYIMRMLDRLCIEGTCLQHAVH